MTLLTRTVLRSLCTALLLIPMFAAAQEADKEKLTAIEKEFAANPNPGPDAAAVAQKYLYDGSLNQVTGMGRVGTLPKSRVVELNSKPDPSDPNVKTSSNISDLHVDLYGQTALVSYKVTATDTGHKDAALNTTDHYGCLDTFIKRNGNWYVIGNACSPAEPLPQSEWEAVKKARTQAPKDVQDAYH
ncbi:MAG: hypothetical protein JO159_20990 [Acidobacteria bacterium]|nr:hypothetical protein [Acidobacteriota bacterium]MBV9622802.1 hypothetical protein [Acidobacteriota bacterium]